MRRKTHERILADHERRRLEEQRELFAKIAELLDRLMYMTGTPYHPPEAEPLEPDEDLDLLPASAIDQYPIG